MIKRQMKWQYKQQMFSFNWNMCVNNCKLREHRPNCRMPCFALKLRSSQAKSECSTHSPASICGERRKMSRMFKSRINWKNSWNLMTFVYIHMNCRFVSFRFFLLQNTLDSQLMVMLFLLLKNCCARSFWL